MKKIIVSIIVIGMLLTTIPINTGGEEAANEEQNGIVVISTEKFELTLKRLIDHFNELGVKTFYKDVDEIYDEYPGIDNLEKIKYFIKDAKETLGVSYVLLVGNDEYIPTREIADEMSINGDDLCCLEDVYIECITCDNNEDLDSIIDELINYEDYNYGEVQKTNDLLNNDINLVDNEDSITINPDIIAEDNNLNNLEFIENTIFEYDMAIISTDSFASTLQPLIDHKNEYGVKTFFKDVDEIYNEYQGRDEPEKIKYFIKDAIETKGISYVLIVGGIDYVPIRKSAVQGDTHHFLIPTDLYYADIYNSTGDFCSWDANNNDIFGEWNIVINNSAYGSDIDEVDLNADVYIGRIPCFNNEELNIVVDKIIYYENNAFGSEWFNRILLLSSDKYTPISEDVGEVMDSHGFELTKLYSIDNNFDTEKINYETTKGAGFLSFMGHGGFSCIMVDTTIYIPLINRTFGRFIYYRNKHLAGMNNGFMLPIAYLKACSTAILDHISFMWPRLAKILNLPNRAGFAYNIVKKEGGGAIASIGATRDTHGNYLDLYFFEEYKPGITIGEMLVNAQYDYKISSPEPLLSFTYQTIQVYLLIGDPSLKVGGYDQSQQGNQQINPQSMPSSQPSQQSNPSSSQTQEQSTPSGTESSSPTNR